jgi:dienelactone hydrolase
VTVETVMARAPTAAAVPLGKQPAELQGADGTTLRGWYVPSRTGAAVIALHGTESDRNGVAPHARMLARHGYGVLAVDLRGHGDSGGRSTSVPWKLDEDLDSAIAWLSRRDDVDDRRIGAVGVSSAARLRSTPRRAGPSCARSWPRASSAAAPPTCATATRIR